MDIISEFENGDVIACIDDNDRLLYAAAPDLLAALEAVTACLRGFHASDDFGPLDDEAINAALDAIDKAKGN